jgi:hypothetical protein
MEPSGGCLSPARREQSEQQEQQHTDYQRADVGRAVALPLSAGREAGRQACMVAVGVGEERGGGGCGR